VLLFSQPDGDNDGSRVWSIRGMMTDKKTEWNLPRFHSGHHKTCMHCLHTKPQPPWWTARPGGRAKCGEEGGKTNKQTNKNNNKQTKYIWRAPFSIAFAQLINRFTEHEVSS
jgi:hypothetical protein